MARTKLQDHFQRPISPTGISKVEMGSEKIVIYLTDGRVIHTPLSWFPILHSAGPELRMKYRISPRGIHWDFLDEDIPIETFLDDYR